MNILLLYVTTNKSTEKISRVLGQRFAQDGHSVTQLDVTQLDHIDPAVFQGVDLIGIGSPVFHLRILQPMKRFLAGALRYVAPQTKAFIFLTYGGISSGKAFLNVVKPLNRFAIGVVGGMKVVAPHFYSKVCYPDEAALETVDEFYNRLVANAFRAIPRHEAIKLFTYQRPAVSIIYPIARLVGHMRQLPIHIDTQKCISCGRCARECPVNAFEMGRYPGYDSHQCIHCYHCTAVCPSSAVVCPVGKVQDMVHMNKKLLGCEQPANEVLM